MYLLVVMTVHSFFSFKSHKMQTNSGTRTDDLVKELANDYANYLIIDSSSEWVKLHTLIKSLSTNVEEFSSLLESINLDTSLCVDNLLPQIVARFDQVKQTFSQIDKLESAVRVVEKSVGAMEMELSTAESHLASESIFKSVFKPFLKSSTPTTPVVPVYKPVDIFQSDSLWKEQKD